MKHRHRSSFSLPRSGSALRLLAGLLVAVLVLAQGASIFHELLVPHRVCAEHGHRVHGGTGEHASDAQHRAGRVLAAAPGNGSEPEGHEHCTLPARPEPNGASLARSSSSELAPVAVFARRVAARERAHAGAPLLLVAPKQSPPLA